MSQENVEVVRRMLDAWAHGDRDTARAAYDENVVFIFPPLDAPISHGVAAMERALETWRRTWDDYSLEIDELIDAGDHVIVVHSQHGRGKGSGVEVELTNATVYTLLGSKIVRGEVFDTKAQALEAVGLSEQAISQENAAIVRRVHDAARRRDAAAVLSLYDPSVECDYSRVSWGDPAGRGVYHGHEGLRQVFREWHEAWESHKADLEELIDAGNDRVISVGTARGRGKASGIEVELPHQAGLWTIRDGKVVRVVWFPTRGEAIEAAGVKE